MVVASFLLLLAGTVTTTWQWLRASGEATRAQNEAEQRVEEAARSSAISEFLMSTFAGMSATEEMDQLSNNPEDRYAFITLAIPPKVSGEVPSMTICLAGTLSRLRLIIPNCYTS